MLPRAAKEVREKERFEPLLLSPSGDLESGCKALMSVLYEMDTYRQ